jgi:hypothetical protein
MASFSSEKGMKVLVEILNIIEFRAPKDSRWELEKVRCLSVIGEVQASSCNVNASKTIEAAAALALKLKQGDFDVDEVILGKIARSLAKIDLGQAIDLVSSMQEGKNKKDAFKGVFEASVILFANQVKENSDAAIKTFPMVTHLLNSLDEETFQEMNEKIIDITRSYSFLCLSSIKMLLDDSSMSDSPKILKTSLNRIIEDLKGIKDPYIISCFLISVSKAIDPSKEPWQACWWALKKKLLGLTAQVVANIDCSLHQCGMYIDLAEQFYFDKSLANDTLTHAVELVKNNKFSNHYLDKSSLWCSICKVQIELDLGEFEKSKTKLLQVIDNIENLSERIEAIFDLVSLTKEQEIFNLAIETALKLDKPALFLAKFASLDLKQTPLILDKIQSCQHDDKKIITIEFLKAIEF